MKDTSGPAFAVNWICMPLPVAWEVEIVDDVPVFNSVPIPFHPFGCYSDPLPKGTYFYFGRW
jgi:hypothetical protein